jgi:methionine synthase I (cobalamin-dependent)
VTTDLSVLKDTVTVADGGWSTQLWERGVPVSQLPEMANLTHPEVVVRLGREYVEAGARFITTNTFAANRYAIARRGVNTTVAELNQAGARLARQAVEGSEALVAGSIGPSGKILVVHEATEAELTIVFDEQARALAEGGVDVIVLETFSELAEILVALRAAQGTGLPVIASLSFDSGPQRTRTIMGAAAEDCAAALEEAGAAVVGCNCGGGAANVLPAVVALRGATKLPLWVKPNAGLPDLEDGRPVYRQPPDEFAAVVPTLIEAGANIIGGCCGTGPEHIRRVAAIVENRKRPRRRDE